MNPIIGIVACGLQNNRQFVSHPYIRAIESAGGLPLVIPRITQDALFPNYAAICDGFLFCGGNDISPLLFGEDLMTDIGHTDEHTDRFHLAFMRYLLPLSQPLLCICRGMQVLNIALGGNIYQDISLCKKHTLNHMQLSNSRSDVCHKVSFSHNSMLYNICGNDLDTNSYHHQCIHNIGHDLKITGLTADGVIEAIETIDRPFSIGVQWHPECMYSTSPAMRELFSRFIEQAKTSKVISIPVSFDSSFD